MAKRQPAAAISQNQNGREMLEEPEEPDEEPEGEEPEDVPEEEEPEEPVAVEPAELVEPELEGAPVCDGLELDNESLGLELKTLETDADGDEPEVDVAVA
jgi:hypothetical protein